MNKNRTTESASTFCVIIFLIIILPINLSYNNITDFTFSAFQFDTDKPSRYLFTLPISFFFIIPFFFIGILNLKSDKLIFLFLIFSLISLISFFHAGNISHLILLAKIVLPILLILGFEIYLKKNFNNKPNIFQTTNNLNRKITLIFLIVFFITMISPLYLDNHYNWLLNGIAIYDYLQYYSIIFILMLGLLASNNYRYIILPIYILCFYLAEWSYNKTFYYFLIFFGIYYLFVFILKKNKRDIVFISKVIISISFIFHILFHSTIIVFLRFFSENFMNNYLGFGARLQQVSLFYNNVSFFEFLTPIRINSDIVSKYYHNEPAVIISVLGIFGTIIFYLIFLKRIWHISRYYPEISVAISLVCILSGNVVTLNLHPYTFIISSFMISYYYSLPKFQK